MGATIAAYELGTIYLYKDINKAIQYFTNAANAGEIKAIIALAALYQFGEGVIQDSDEAIFWYEKITTYNPQKNIELSRLYLQKLNSNNLSSEQKEKYCKKAAMLLQEAANDNIAEAQFMLGVLYYWGIGIPKHHELAKNIYF